MRNVNLDKWGFWLFCQVWWSVPILPWEYRRGACGKEAMQRVSQRTLQALCLHRHCIASLASESLQTLESHWISLNLIESHWISLNLLNVLERAWTWQDNGIDISTILVMLNRGMVTAVAIPMTPVAAPVTAPMFPAGTSKRAFAPLATDAGAPVATNLAILKHDEARFSGQTGDIWRFWRNQMEDAARNTSKDI